MRTLTESEQQTLVAYAHRHSYWDCADLDGITISDEAYYAAVEWRYEWKRADGRRVSDKLIREIIGESIPPKGLEPIVKHILAMYEGTVLAHPRKQLGLF